MVRNAASIQNLRESMAYHQPAASASGPIEDSGSTRHQGCLPTNMPTSGSPFGSQQMPYRPAQQQQIPVAQLYGGDEMTKRLMNRIATGEASAAEEQAFAWRARTQAAEHSFSTLPRLHPIEASRGLQAYEAQLQLQSQANQVPGGNHALNDYQSQLMLLEQQNQRRLAEAGMARPEHEEYLRTLKTKKEQETRLPTGEVPLSHRATRINAEKYTKPFCDFLTDNPTVFHAVDAVKRQLEDEGFEELSERDKWVLEPSGKYFVERNGSSMIAFVVGEHYEPGNGAAILAGHVDALTAKLKPISQVPNKAGYLQLGVAPYAGAPNAQWWDRDLSVGGRVILKKGGKIVTELVKLDWPIARIPTLAPHFGAAAQGPFNPETQMTPIIGLEATEAREMAEPFSTPSLLGTSDGKVGSFVSTQPPRLVRAIGKTLGLSSSNFNDIINWELELFDVQPAALLGLDKEFISAGRIDDKLCSWAAIQALIEADKSDTASSSIIKAVGLFDDEEIGSGLRQGAHGNLLQSVLERAVGSLNGGVDAELIGRTYANSFLVSSDVTHAVNPNFLNAYLENHSPQLNVGLVVSADSNGHMTTDSVSTALLQRCADKVGAKLQVFQIRNDSRSGGTVGPMLSSATGIRAIDAGIPQLSMHSIRATTGSLDPGLGVLAFLGFLNGFESVDRDFK